VEEGGEGGSRSTRLLPCLKWGRRTDLLTPLLLPRRAKRRFNIIFIPYFLILCKTRASFEGWWCWNNEEVFIYDFELLALGTKWYMITIIIIETLGRTTQFVTKKSIPRWFHKLRKSLYKNSIYFALY
jgi:hypothetical protein